MRAPALVAVLVLAGASPALAALEATVGVVTSVRGVATVTCSAASRPTPLRGDDPVLGADQITVGKRSTARVLLGGTAVITVHELSVLTIAGDDATLLTLHSGAIAATAGRRSGDLRELRTPNAVVRLDDALVVVEVELPSTPAITRTRLCVRRGVVLVRTRWFAGSEVGVGPLECVAVSGGFVGQPHDGRYHEINRALAFAQRPPRADPTPRPIVVVRPEPPRPGDWTLLIDRGQGFVPWVGTASEGYITGDASYVSISLSTCDQAAKNLAGQGARAACVLSVHATRHETEVLQYRDRQGRVLARGVLAGRLVVYEREPAAFEWRRIRLGGRSQPPGLPDIVEPRVSAGRSAFGIVTCYNSLEWLQRTACVRLAGPSADYRDANGRLLVEGPFAGGLIVVDPVRP